ncbi:MAG: response regulator [Verrucomicrobiales bacterium]|nr:response regulator [Verrucomicrobiales bacterium]
MSIGLPEESNALKSPPSPGNAGILVVDEDPAFQLGLKTFLREYVGFDQVFTARSGAEALDLLETEESIDVITLDYQMPGMNGIEFMEELRETDPRPLSVIMITGYPSEELEEEFRSFSSPTLLADHFLHKPVEFEKLEPLVLKAHEELLSARIAAEEEAELGAEEVEEELIEDEPMMNTRGIETTLFRQETKIDALKEQIRTIRKKSRRDSILLGLLVIAMGAAINFGWFGILETAYQDAKSDMQRVFSKAPPAAEPSEPVVSPEISPAPIPDNTGDPL